MNRSELRREVLRRLEGRRLVWVGTRGDDVESVSDLDPLTHAFSIISAYRRRPSVQSMALEDITGRRIDLDTFDLDANPRDPHVVELRQAVLRALARPSAVFTYRPTTFLSAITFARKDRCQHLGMFRDHQAIFEHKPWVESAIAALGVPHIPWTYIADDNQLDAVRYLADGPIVLRRSRTTGGVGLTRLDDANQLADLWPDEDEAFVSVAPYIDPTIPVNVGAVVWNDGVTVHPASVQLIGIPGCTSRPFGYCGNDFGAVADLGRRRIEEIERSTVQIGEWLRGYGYRGAFGVDFLVTEQAALFTEVNPRFQGSTHLSNQIDVAANESCLLLEHLAAHLGSDAPPSRPLFDQASDHGPIAHLVVHWTGSGATTLDPVSLARRARTIDPDCRSDVLARDPLTVEPGGTIARITTRTRLTTTGFSIVPDWQEAIHSWNEGAQARLDASTNVVGSSASQGGSK